MWEFYKKRESILSNGEIDFIALAVTQWHASSVKVQIMKRGFKKGVIIILPHPKNGFLISDKDFKIDKNNFKILYLNVNMSLFNKAKVNFSTFFSTLLFSKKNKIKKMAIISPSKPAISLLGVLRKYKNIEPIFVIIDEGIGSYVPQEIFLDISKLDYVSPALNKLFSLLKSYYIKYFICKKIECIEDLLFYRQDNKLIVNGELLKYYKRLYLSKPREYLKNKALIITQPFSEYNILDREKEIKIIKEVIKIILKDFEQVLIKPHPREDEKKYLELVCSKVKLLDKNFSLEDFLSNNIPDIIIGYNSTGLLTASCIYDIKTCTMFRFLAPFLGEKYKNIFKIYNELLKNYIEEL